MKFLSDFMRCLIKKCYMEKVHNLSRFYEATVLGFTTQTPPVLVSGLTPHERRGGKIVKYEYSKLFYNNWDLGLFHGVFHDIKVRRTHPKFWPDLPGTPFECLISASRPLPVATAVIYLSALMPYLDPLINISIESTVVFTPAGNSDIIFSLKYFENETLV